MIKRNQVISFLVAMATLGTVVYSAGGLEVYAQENKAKEINSLEGSENISHVQLSIPKQVNVHMGEDPSKEVNFTYTTKAAGLETKVVLNKVGSSEKKTIQGENSIGNADKYFHKIMVKNLEPNTNYEYTVGTGDNTYSGNFKTAPAKGSKDSFKFAFLADTQVSTENDAKALGATFNELNKTNDLDFVYLAGDITNTATSESQWEYLFNNKGSFKDAGQEMFGNNLITAVQGNHDNNSLTRHINAPNQAGNIVYSYDYGPATFVMLNLEEARYSADAREEQKQHLISVVNEAKARNQWTLVGFHKSIYTGASHITDSDIIEARKYWAPIFSELDIDVVMQGHDHVYSRGFVNENGGNANPSSDKDGNVINPKNSPLYMVGGHAGGLKWYSKKNYTVGTGDPLEAGYSFLDVNSTDTGSDVKKEQVIVELDVSEDSLTLNSYMFKYDTATDTITTDKYLYDSMTMVKNQEGYEAKMPNITNINGKAGTEFKIPVSVNKFPVDKTIRGSEMIFDLPSDIDIKNVSLNNKIIKASNWDHNVSEGKLRVALTNLDDEPIFVNNIEGDKNVITLDAVLKEDKKSTDSTNVKLSQLTLRCEDNVDVDYDTSKANSKITFIEQESSKASAREIYKAEGSSEVIPSNLKAVAVEFTLMDEKNAVKFGDNDFYYSPDFTKKTGKLTYVALVPKDLSIENLSDISKYDIKCGTSENIVFGDINADGIDAQDALTAVSSWLRKTKPNEESMLGINVSGDGRINTRDSIDIVDNFVSGKDFAILSK